MTCRVCVRVNLSPCLCLETGMSSCWVEVASCRQGLYLYVCCVYMCLIALQLPIVWICLCLNPLSLCDVKWIDVCRLCCLEPTALPPVCVAYTPRSSHSRMVVLRCSLSAQLVCSIDIRLNQLWCHRTSPSWWGPSCGVPTRPASFSQLNWAQATTVTDSGCGGLWAG